VTLPCLSYAGTNILYFDLFFDLSLFYMPVILIYYIDTDEIQRFFHLLKGHIFTAHSENTIFVFHMWGYCDKWHFAISDYLGCFGNE